jgi:hypothetical protein
MIDLTIKTPDKDYNLKCPKTWQEVTVNQFIQLENNWDGKDLIQLLSILTELPRYILVNAHRTVIDKVDDLVSFIFKEPPDFNKLKRKKTITILNKPVKMPKSLEMESFGAALMVLEVLEDPKDMIPKIPYIMAVYSQPVIDGKFIESRIPEIETEINKMPIVDVYPHCFFFFKKLLKFKKTGIST